MSELIVEYNSEKEVWIAVYEGIEYECIGYDEFTDGSMVESDFMKAVEDTTSIFSLM